MCRGGTVCRIHVVQVRAEISLRLRFDNSIVDTVDEAVELANATDYSLAASVWTSDLSVGMQVASRINAGMHTTHESSKPLLTSPFRLGLTAINGTTLHSENAIDSTGLGCVPSLLSTWLTLIVRFLHTVVQQVMAGLTLNISQLSAS